MTKANLFKNLKLILYGVYAILIIATSYHLVYGRRIIPGLKIGNVYVGGLSALEAHEKLVSADKTLQKTLVLTNQGTFGKNYEIKATDIELTYDWDASIARAFEVGRTGNVLTDSKDKLAALIKGINLKAIYDTNDDAFSNALAVIKGDLDKESKDAKIVDTPNGTLEVTPSASGYIVDANDLYGRVVNSFEFLDFSAKNIPIEEDKPTILETEVLKLLPKVEKILSTPIIASYNNKTWTITRAQTLSLLAISKNAQGSLDLVLNTDAFEGYASSIAQSINVLPRGQVTIAGEKVIDFKIIQDGKELDFSKFEADFERAFLKTTLAVSTTDPIILELPMKSVSGPATKEKYGIFSLLGTGESKYAGSIPGRIHNVALATERANGVLVPPGAIYSFNESIGEISGKTGYDSAYIIQNGRTVLGEGGGVCQVSTTMFRAVLNAGLPVVMRYPHAYRVHYYEEGSPVGVDASVFQPTADFKFKNDTPNYVLIQTENDPANVHLTFKIYGTPDGRTVEISKPVILSQTPPPAPLYQDDPTIAKGRTVQVDFEAWGANVKFSRVVKKGDTVLYNDSFSSSYQPWRAVFLVGTR